jgi:hypothetical protein
MNCRFLRLVCWNLFAETCLLRLVCWDLFAETCLLRLVCWDLFAEACLLRLVCWDLFLETCLLRLYCWDCLLRLVCWQFIFVRLVCWVLFADTALVCWDMFLKLFAIHATETVWDLLLRLLYLFIWQDLVISYNLIVYVYTGCSSCVTGHPVSTHIMLRDLLTQKCVQKILVTDFGIFRNIQKISKFK